MYIPVPRTAQGYGSSSMTLSQSRNKRGCRSLKLVLHATHPETVKSDASKEDAPASAPIIVRNSSGQVVRPCLKKSLSEGSSPTSMCPVPRFVHFNSDLTHTRWFFKAETPKCAASDPSFHSGPESSECTNSQSSPSLNLVPVAKPNPSFVPYEPSPVVLESVQLSSGNKLTGSIKVHNIAYEKHITVRYTSDSWKSFKDSAPAQYDKPLSPSSGSCRRPGVDRFKFSIPLTAEEAAQTSTLSLCVRYRVNGSEYWDSNNGTNYTFKFTLTPPINASAGDKPFTKTAMEDDHDALVPVKKAVTFHASYKPRPSSRSKNANSSSCLNYITVSDVNRYMRESEAMFSFGRVSPSHAPPPAQRTVRLEGKTQPHRYYYDQQESLDFALPSGSLWYASTAAQSSIGRSQNHQIADRAPFTPPRSISPSGHTPMRTGSPLSSKPLWATHPVTTLLC